MKLKKFTVECFRSIIRRSAFNVSDRTILIGPNNEGKSNILRALVIALKELTFIAQSPQTVRREGKTLIYMSRSFGREYSYSWDSDYPIKLQKSKKDISKKKSIFILDFELDEDEFGEFKAITNTKFKHRIIPVRLEMSADNIIFTLNIPGHFCNGASETKMFKIASFITKKINICYIDAVRTASTASQSVTSLLSIEVQKIHEKPEYKRVLKELRALYDPLLNEMSQRVNELLRQFIPNIKKTHIEMMDDLNLKYYRRPQFSVDVDDGVNTALSQKGSGVQSLVALSLAQYVSANTRESDNFILAIEEPESHLHPDAIHEIRNVLLKISQKNQLIITTHSPLFVETSNPHMNIIVRDNIAEEAVKIADIRNVLGVSPADNLISAELVLIVEGAADENMLPHLLAIKSPSLRRAITQKRLIVSSTGGTNNMENYTRFIQHNLCKIHVLVDNDEAGRHVIENMKRKGVINDTEYTILSMLGMSNSEIDDLFDPTVYSVLFASKYGVPASDINNISVRSKWSERMKNIFRSAGKTWSDEDEIEAKKLLSETIKNIDHLAFISHREDTFNALCLALEQKL